MSHLTEGKQIRVKKWIRRHIAPCPELRRKLRISGANSPASETDLVATGIAESRAAGRWPSCFGREKRREG
jgi:hypothetical protein